MERTEENLIYQELMEFTHQGEYLSGGKLLEWHGEFQKVYSPVCNDDQKPEQILIGDYPLLDQKSSLDVLDNAVQAYGNGAGIWPALVPKRRITYVKKFLDEFRRTRNEVVKYLIWEIGKNATEAEKEFDRTVEYIHETIDYYSDKTETFKNPRKKGNISAKVTLQPRGIVLCMGPYNYPLNETFTTLIPALITGNVVIFKPPRLGVLLHRPVLKVLQKVFPAGVVNTVYGEGQKVIQPLMESGKIDVLAFIGSSKVADILKKSHPQPHRLHTILGLEAKNPAIIFNKCDIDKTVSECVKGTLSYNGQRCTALKILFVEREVSDIFAKRMSEAVNNLRIGLPWQSEADITPLPETSKSQYLTKLIDDAKRHGAKVINQYGGEFYKTYFKPAVLYPVDSNMKVYREEQFGPVIPIVPFDDFSLVYNYVIESNYGQQLSVFTQDHKEIDQVCLALGNQIARININMQCQRGPDTMPFTGRKDSAEGVLSVSEAIKEFTVPLVIAKER